MSHAPCGLLLVQQRPKIVASTAAANILALLLLFVYQAPSDCLPQCWPSTVQGATTRAFLYPVLTHVVAVLLLLFPHSPPLTCRHALPQAELGLCRRQGPERRQLQAAVHVCGRAQRRRGQDVPRCMQRLRQGRCLVRPRLCAAPRMCQVLQGARCDCLHWRCRWPPHVLSLGLGFRWLPKPLTLKVSPPK